MVGHSSLFSQLLCVVNRHRFERRVGEYRAEKAAKGFSCWSQFVAMMTLALGILIGIGNGFLVTGLGINPLVATLGTMSVTRGSALVLTEGRSTGNLPREFVYVGDAACAGLPLMVITMLVIVVAGDVALRHTRYLRQVYYIGANGGAARLSGILVTSW
jgi:ribose/xylose/arabinose/galactoside ABC-type transport system permease subunit